MAKEMRDGPSRALDHMLLYQMLGDPSFYAAVPTFFFLKEVGLAVTTKIRDAILKGDDGCGGCGGIRQAMQPAIEPFVTHLRKVAAEAPDMLDPLIAYVSGRLGFRPRPLIVYYRGSGGRPDAVEM